MLCVPSALLFHTFLIFLRCSNDQEAHVTAFVVTMSLKGAASKDIVTEFSGSGMEGIPGCDKWLYSLAVSYLYLRRYRING